jgi:hypothetical protein
VSIASAYDDYAERLYRALNLYFPVSETLNILTGNDDLSELPLEDEEEELDDEFSDG